MYAVETNQLCKVYGQNRAVWNFDMHVPEGAVYGFVGKNGAGKSTVMKLIACLATPTSGAISLYGRVSEGIERSGLNRVGVLIETPGLLPNLSAFDNLYYKALSLGIVDAKMRCRDILRTVGLGGASTMRAKKFSLGMRQRLGVGLALLGSPDLLLLDEPFNGLDPEGTRELRNLITDLSHNHGVTFVISSHVLDQLDRMATCYGVIAHGQMIREMSAEQVDLECGDSMRLRVDRPEQALVRLQESDPNLICLMEPGDYIRLRGDVDPQLIAQTLHDAGFVVYELTVVRRDIEDYFVELMDGGAHYAESA